MEELYVQGYEHGRNLGRAEMAVGTRDKFALAALQIISAPIGGGFPDEMAVEIAQHAYRIADAMLAERAKRK